MIKKVIILSLIALALNGCQEEKSSKEVLFVCTHGAARSPIATAYFNKIAKEKKLNYHAIFRGTEPDKALTPETDQGLNQDNFNILGWKPIKVSLQDVEKAFKVITFDCSVPSQKSQAPHENWTGIPSISKDYKIARDVIKEKVEELIKELEKEE